MFCTSCGAKLKEDQKFCTSCGAKVEAAPAQGGSGAGLGGGAPAGGAPAQGSPAANNINVLESAVPETADIAAPVRAGAAGSSAGGFGGFASAGNDSPATTVIGESAAPATPASSAPAATSSAVATPAGGTAASSATPAAEDEGLSTTILAALEEAAKDPIAEFNKEPSIKLIATDGREFKTQKFPCTVGKGSAANLQISGNNAISREHLLLTFADGKFFAEDQNSSNHTFINGEKVEPKTAHELNTGDILKLADEPFTVEVDV